MNLGQEQKLVYKLMELLYDPQIKIAYTMLLPKKATKTNE